MRSLTFGRPTGRRRVPVAALVCVVCVAWLAPAPGLAQSASPPPVKVGPLTVSGYLQLDSQTVLEERSSAAEPPATFSIPRARFVVSGELAPRLTWVVQADFSNLGNDGRVLRDAYVSFAATRAFGIRFGQFVAPFSLERLTSTSRLEVIDRSVIGTSLSASRDYGVMLYSPQPIRGWLTYYGAVVNGAGQNRLDDNDAKDVVGRAAVLVPGVPGLSVGVNGTAGTQPTGDRTRAGLDVSYERPAYRFVVETVRQTLDGSTRRETEGVSLLAVYRRAAAPRRPHYAGFEIVGRYVHVDDSGGALTTDNLQFGGNYFVTPQVRVMNNLVVPFGDDQPRNAVRWWTRVQFLF